MAMKLPIVQPQTAPLEKFAPESYVLKGYERNAQEEFTAVNLPIVSQEELKNCVTSYAPIKIVPDPNRPGHWLIVQGQQENANVLQGSGMAGQFYLECADGIYTNDDEANRRKIFDIKVKITKVIEIWSSEGNCRKQYVCKLFSPVWNEESREIIIASEKYKELFKVIHRRFPEIFLPDTTSEIVQEYLTDVYRRDIKGAEVIVQAEKMGWITIHGKTIYMIGVDDFYKTCNIPDIDKCDRIKIFNNGTSFLEVGNSKEIIAIVWLTAHIALANYWFNEGGKKFTSAIYLSGATNFFKTSVVKVVANPFDQNRDNTTVRMTSTSASIRDNMSMLADTLVCIDDFSNTELTSSKKALENAEDVIRAVGDGVFPAKMNVKDFSKSVREAVRSTIILTGEENLPLGTSSQYRMIKLPVEKETFNGETLRIFQNNPKIMAEYFALYVKYLTERNDPITNVVAEKIAEYSREFEQHFSVRRFIETAAFLKFQVDILYDFAIWCGIDENEVQQLANLLNNAVFSVVTLNQSEGTKISPVKQILFVTWQNMNSSNDSLIADSEDVYVQNELRYLGFHEKTENLLWLKPTNFFKIGVELLKKQGVNLLVQWDSLKKMLLNEGYSKGVLPVDGKGGKYLLRAKKGSRKYMLVLHMDKVETLVAELMDEKEN